jgi:Effector-associated domain 1
LVFDKEFDMEHLEDVLADLYSDNGSATLLVKKVGLAEGKIDFAGIPSVVCMRIITQSHNEGKLEKLVEEAVQDGNSAQRERLERALSAYKSRKAPPHLDAQPTSPQHLSSNQPTSVGDTSPSSATPSVPVPDSTPSTPGVTTPGSIAPSPKKSEKYDYKEFDITSDSQFTYEEIQEDFRSIRDAKSEEKNIPLFLYWRSRARSVGFHLYIDEKKKESIHIKEFVDLLHMTGLNDIVLWLNCRMTKYDIKCLWDGFFKITESNPDSSERRLYIITITDNLGDDERKKLLREHVAATTRSINENNEFKIIQVDEILRTTAKSKGDRIYVYPETTST